MLKLGYLEASETPEAADIADCFDAANTWLDTLALKRTHIFYTERVVEPLVSGTATYTIGPTGAIPRLRPAFIDKWSIVLDRTATNPIERPMGRPLLIDAYQAIAMKNLAGQWPTAIYYDHAFVAGVGTISVFPVPNQSASDLILYIPTPLGQFADQAATDYTFPAGYKRFIEHAIAREIAPILGAEVSQALEMAYEEAKFDIEAANFQPTELGMDSALLFNRGRRTSIEFC